MILMRIIDTKQFCVSYNYACLGMICEAMEYIKNELRDLVKVTYELMFATVSFNIQ